MRIIAVGFAALASWAAHCNHSPWGIQPVTAERVPSVYFDSGAVVRVQLRTADVMTGALLESVTPGGDELVLDLDKSVRLVRLSEIQQLKIPYPGTSIGADLGFRVGGIAALSHDENDEYLFMAGMLAGAIVGGAIGSRVTRWLTVAKRSDFGNLTWMPEGPQFIPATYGLFNTSCMRVDSAGESLVALVDYTDGPFHTKILKAWAVDTVGHHMSPIPTTQVRCRNSSWETPLALASATEETRALRFTPSGGKALIYVHQRPSWGAQFPQLDIVLDGRRAGRTSPGTYRVYEVDPGTHRIGALNHDDKAVAIDAAPDSVYFVRFREKRGVRHGSFGGVELVADRTRGQQMILAAQLLRPSP